MKQTRQEIVKTKPFPDNVSTTELEAKMKRLCPDLKGVKSFLEKDPKEIFYQTNPALRNKRITSKMKNAMTRIIESSRTPLVQTRRLTREFTPSVRTYRSIIVNNFLARPALLIQNGDFFSPPEESEWFGILNQNRAMIDGTFESIGRIEYMRDNKEWNMATGFLVADDVIMTAAHVAERFCDQIGGQWAFDTNTKEQRIDYCQEKDATTSREFKIKKILKIYDNIDLALFQVCKTSHGRKHPKPLTVASNMPSTVKDRNVYVVGHPIYDTWADGDLNLIFGNDWGVKRLQPGKTKSLQNGILYHDCSTVSGNSGSCVIDIEKNQVVGLHFHGKDTSDFNEAVALPPLKTELEQYGVEFA